MKWQKFDHFQDEKKSPLKPKQRDDGKPSLLEQYEKLKNLYEDLRPIDVKFTLDHDAWKKNIDKKTEDKHLENEMRVRHRKEKSSKMKEKLLLIFKKYEGAELKVEFSKIQSQD